MLITYWNEASRALPVLTLKSNYLDRWPNDCVQCIGTFFELPLSSSTPIAHMTLEPLGHTKLISCFWSALGVR